MGTVRDEYIRRMNAIAARYGELEDRTVHAILRELERTRDQVAALIARGGEDVTRWRERMQRLDALMAELEGRLQRIIAESAAQTVEHGAAYAVEPLQAAGLVGGAAFDAVTLAQANVWASYAAQIARGLTDEVRQAVNRVVRDVGLGTLQPFEAMQRVTQIFGEAGVYQGREVVRGVSARAERTVRTELQRGFNLAAHSQQMSLARRVPGLRKRWIATADGRTRRGHLEIHRKTARNPIPVDAPFHLRDWRYTKGRGWYIASEHDLMYPGDPSAPPEYTVNCRCTMALIHPEIGVIGSSLDGRIAAMLKRAEQMQG